MKSDNLFKEDLIIIIPPILVLLFGMIVYSAICQWHLTRNSVCCVVSEKWMRTREILTGLLEENKFAHKTLTFNKLWLALSDINEIIALDDGRLWILIEGRDSSSKSFVYIKDHQSADIEARERIMAIIESGLPMRHAR